MLFPDIARACEAVLVLKDCRVSAAELMDRVSLRSVENKPGMPPYIKSLGDTVTALLVDTAADDTATLQQQVDQINARFAGFPMVREFEFSTDPDQAADLWSIRSGLFPSHPLNRSSTRQASCFPNAGFTFTSPNKYKKSRIVARRPGGDLSSY